MRVPVSKFAGPSSCPATIQGAAASFGISLEHGVFRLGVPLHAPCSRDMPTTSPALQLL